MNSSDDYGVIEYPGGVLAVELLEAPTRLSVRLTELAQVQNIVGTIPHTQTATDTGAEKVRFRQRTWWANIVGRLGGGPVRIDTQTQAKQADPAGGLQHIAEKLPAVDLLPFRFINYGKVEVWLPRLFVQ